MGYQPMMCPPVTWASSPCQLPPRAKCPTKIESAAVPRSSSSVPSVSSVAHAHSSPSRLPHLSFDIAFPNPMTPQPPRKLKPKPRPTQRPLPESFQLIVDCKTEAHQKQLYEQLTKAG